MPSQPLSHAPRNKPPALRPGDSIGIVAPASAIKQDLLDAGCQALEKLGYKPFYLPSILDQDLYFAGSVRRRARELEEMFERDEVRAIICARGGYGCNYLLRELDLEKIRAHPKIFMGYSDVTTLLTWFGDQANLVTFHGPMLTKDFANGMVDLATWSAATGGKSQWEIGAAPAYSVVPLVRGSANGILYGGCLSMLVASLGTEYAIRTEGTLLFIEDVAVKPYQIDRMLMQLKLAGKLDSVRGIIFGEMLDCAQPQEKRFTLMEVIKRVVGDLGIPVAYGLPSGHVSGENITLPLGINASLTVGESVRLTVLEPATARVAVSAHSAAPEK
jgi:muramoyltetrapeptide carboxypeptidase